MRRALTLATNLTLALLLLFGASLPGARADVPALSLPDTVNAFETFEVQLSGPGESGDMLRFADAGGEVLGGSYAYAGNAKNGVVRLTAPLDPGDYAVVYLSNREVVASYPIVVLPVSATLSAPAEAGINATVTVTFEGPRNNGDYVQFTDAAGKPIKGLYAYVGNARGDSVALRAPTAAGDYRVAYFTGRREIGAVEMKIGGTDAELEASKTVAAGAHFEVRWQGPDNTGDMLRVLDAAGTATGSYGYTGHNPGSVTLRAPEVTGTYRVVYLTGGQVIGETTVEVVSVSASLEAPPTVTGAEYFDVRWEGPGNRGDTVQMVLPGTTDDVAYTYIDAERGPEVRLAAPESAGDYELQYLSHGGRVLASRPVQVTPPPEPPGSLLVEVLPVSGGLGSGDAVEVVLDASGSMLQRIGGERRIDIARRTLDALVSETIPAGTPFALRVFGHREADACRTDLEIPLGPLDPAAARRSITGINAKNLAKTPLAESLRLTGADLHGVTGERIIILVTDGEETCDGDPAAEIAALRAGGIDLRVNIVGFAIDDADLADSFARWARLGGGEYFSAADGESLAGALVSAVNPVFSVYDGQGGYVAGGTAGGESVTLPAGEYSVEIAGTRYPVTVQAGERTRLEPGR